MQVNRPREYRPELADASKPLSREEKMRASLGLDADGAAAGEEEEEEDAPAAPSRSKGGDSSAAMRELEKRNKELEEKLANEGARRDEQVETIKKLANSRMANITKGFEEKLAAKEREFEELQGTSSNDVQQMEQLRNRVQLLEQQMRQGGMEPPASAVNLSESEDRVMQELDRLRKENANLRSRPAPAPGASNGSSDGNVKKLETENRDLKKMVDNLTEANSKLVANTKTKVSELEKQLERQRSGKGAEGGASSGGGGAAVEQLQKVIEEESKAREAAQAEVASLKTQLAAANAAKSGNEAAASKEMQKAIHEKEKEVTMLQQKLKGQEDDAAIREKNLKSQIQNLEAEQTRIQEQGTVALQETKAKIKKHARRVMTALSSLKAAQQAVKQSSSDLQTEIIPTMKQFYQPLKKAVGRIEKNNSGWAEKYKAEVAERKRLHNLVLELKGNIRVFCRVRPKLKHETGDGISNAIFFPEDGRPELEENTLAIMDDTKGTEKIFEFDCCFGPNSTQEQVFEEVEALVTSTLDGYNVCIFAYGQTGSGKTYTMEGSESDKGINPRTLSRIFEQIQERGDNYSYTVEFSILEIYNEEIRDLLDAKSGKKLDVRQGPDGNYISDLYLASVKSYDEVIEYWGKARENRTTFSNNVNEHSSRSHLVVSVYTRGENRSTGVGTFGKLHLVDLAGSERLSRTGATGDRLKEAQNINKSLSALGDVIAAAASKQGHIPYRNSKLTHVLQDSLGQDSKTLMIVQSSPLSKDAGESLCSLNFASRARSVELGQAKKNTTVKKK